MGEHARKTAIITGAAKRVGQAVALGLHESGYDIAIHHRLAKTDAQALCERMNTKRPDSAIVVGADLSDKAALVQMRDTILSWRSDIDVLVNNASVFERDEETDRDYLFHVNVRAPYLLSHHLKEALAKKQGCIINMADIFGEQPLEGYTVYCMSKAALLMQTKCLAQAFAPAVRVNTILPGIITWPEDETALSVEAKEKMLSKQLLKRVGGYDAIVKTVHYLVQNDFVTGTKCVVDGGCAS